MAEPLLHPWWPDGLPFWAHPHLVFELLAYPVGFQAFLALRRRNLDPVRQVEHRGWIIAAAAMGAAFGSRLLYWAEDPRLLIDHWREPAAWSTGRTLVGALLGGWIAVEVVKKALGLKQSTGDVVVLPLALGIGVGRLGCFFSGVTDGTHGVPTDLFVGMDLGDGIPRHPAALYEIVWIAVVTIALWLTRGTERFEGERFLRFMAAYLGFRFVIEFIKTQPSPYWGLSAIQVASLLALGYCGWRLARPEVPDAPR
jgi:phosphatidylglycerol:prolipoprotein diacylglycerol transferase